MISRAGFLASPPEPYPPWSERIGTRGSAPVDRDADALYPQDKMPRCTVANDGRHCWHLYKMHVTFCCYCGGEAQRHVYHRRNPDHGPHYPGDVEYSYSVLWSGRPPTGWAAARWAFLRKRWLDLRAWWAGRCTDVGAY